MFNWFREKIVGIDCDDGAVVATQLLKKMNRVVSGEAVVVFGLNELSKNPITKDAKIIINLPAQVVLFRSFHLASSFFKSKNQQREITLFLQHQNLPFKLEECFWDTFILDTNLNLIAAKKEVVQKHISQIEELGLNCNGVVPSLIALHNVLIYNYPERNKDRYILLNIRSAACELIIYESNRLWAYPLPIGKLYFKESQDNQAKFSQEVQRIFNAHYLQNPGLTKNTNGLFFISGQEWSEPLVSSLKAVFGDFEITAFDPFKKITPGPGSLMVNKQVMALSLGLGLTYLRLPAGININLIKGKIKKEKNQAHFNFLKSFSLSVVIAAIATLLLSALVLIKNLKTQTAVLNKTRMQISAVLPEVKILKQEKEKIQKLRDYLEKKLWQQQLYLEALSEITQSKPASVSVKEFEAEIKNERLQIVLSGNSPSYEDMNGFLATLKKNENVKEPKVVASTFPAGQQQDKPIDFKLRFELE